MSTCCFAYLEHPTALILSHFCKTQFATFIPFPYLHPNTSILLEYAQSERVLNLPKYIRRSRFHLISPFIPAAFIALFLFSSTQLFLGKQQKRREKGNSYQMQITPFTLSHSFIDTFSVSHISPLRITNVLGKLNLLGMQRKHTCKRWDMKICYVFTITY